MKIKNVLIILLLLPLFNSCKKKEPVITDNLNRKWWKEAVVYQIYPRSFMDTNGDGVGDLNGITQKLDYVKSLGIDAVWLNPIYGSPNADNGYDISDYQSIMNEFGTMTDFETMLQGFHSRKIKVVLDLVVNHCSDEHKWFQEARKSRDNPYRNYFHWWPAENGKPPFRPGAFEVDGSGWRYEKLTNSYYLHYFSYKQPDLNWENPKLRQEIFTMMNWWFKKGIDGFRMDVIPVIAKDTKFPVITEDFLNKNFNGDWFQYFASTPAVHDYLKEMNKQVLSKYDCMALAEGAGMTKETALNFVDADRKELDMGYHFDGVNLGYVNGKFKTMNPNWSLVNFKKIYSDWDAVYRNKGWGTIYLGNHDQPRMVSRWGNDSIEYRVLSSKMLTTFLLTMGGTPFYYYGDEIGMNNIKFNKIDDYRDIETLAEYEKVKNKGGDVKQFIEDQKMGGARDNGRTPMQWNGTKNAGFTTGNPWLKVNENYSNLNVEAQEKDPNSNLNYFRKMIQIRKSNLALMYGKYTLLDPENPDVYAYTRELNDEKILVLLSFSKKIAQFQSDIDFKNAKILIGNYNNPSIDGSLQPYEAVVYKL